MKAAFADSGNRIAPVFDVVRQIHVVDAEHGRILHERSELFNSNHLPIQRVHRLAELGINTLVCGAISRPLYNMVVTYGIGVIAFVAGDLQDVIQAWLRGDQDWSMFAMPGCFGRGGRKFTGMHDIYQEEYLMNGKKGGGMGQGGGRGQGCAGQRPGRMNGPFAAGPSGLCVCTKCGHEEVHERGAPCVGRKCPKCGATMIRR